MPTWRNLELKCERWTAFADHQRQWTSMMLVERSQWAPMELLYLITVGFSWTQCLLLRVPCLSVAVGTSSTTQSPRRTTDTPPAARAMMQSHSNEKFKERHSMATTQRAKVPLPGFLVAAMDVRQRGPRQWRGALQHLQSHRTRAQHDRRNDPFPHDRVGRWRQRKCLGAAGLVSVATPEPPNPINKRA